MHGHIEPFQLRDNLGAYIKRFDYLMLTNGIGDDADKLSHLLTLGGPAIGALVETLRGTDERYAPTYDVITALLLHTTRPPSPSASPPSSPPASPLASPSSSLNPVAERVKFHTRNQQPHETAAVFVAAVRKLATTCDFGDFLESALVDRIVAGVLNDDLRNRLLDEPPSLSVDRAEQIVVEFVAPSVAPLATTSSSLSVGRHRCAPPTADVYTDIRESGMLNWLLDDEYCASVQRVLLEQASVKREQRGSLAQCSVETTEVQFESLERAALEEADEEDVELTTFEEEMRRPMPCVEMQELIRSVARRVADDFDQCVATQQQETSFMVWRPAAPETIVSGREVASGSSGILSPPRIGYFLDRMRDDGGAVHKEPESGSSATFSPPRIGGFLDRMQHDAAKREPQSDPSGIFSPPRMGYLLERRMQDDEYDDEDDAPRAGSSGVQDKCFICCVLGHSPADCPINPSKRQG